MNNEKYNQIIDEAYDNYRAKAKLSQIPTDLTKEEFVELCKNDITFSVYWGLKIEEREVVENESPTKLITLTYNNETIETYE